MKRINGTWFEFQHHNIPEGKYWNPICIHFSDEQWRQKIREVNSLGMKYVVLLCTALFDKAYFKTDIYPRFELAATDPLEAILDEADKCGMKIFMSAGFYGTWTETYNNMVSKEVEKRAFQAMDELFALYGHHDSFYGWYLPDEAWIGGYFNEDFMKFINAYTAHARTLKKGFTNLIAPYGTKDTIPDDKYVKQLESIDIDIIAYQDEVGVQKTTSLETPRFYEGLRKAHDKAGRSALWADMEVFRFEEKVYHSALLPAPIKRIEGQLKAISPYVDEVLIYQYMGLMNQPGTTAFCGHPDSIKLYEDYKKLMNI